MLLIRFIKDRKPSPTKTTASETDSKEDLRSVVYLVPVQFLFFFFLFLFCFLPRLQILIILKLWCFDFYITLTTCLTPVSCIVYFFSHSVPFLLFFFSGSEKPYWRESVFFQTLESCKVAQQRSRTPLYLGLFYSQ